jgi:SAM-dependent methyltransferase
MDVTAIEFAKLHVDSFSTHVEFVSDMIRSRSSRPARDKWADFKQYLREGPLLEIGPGTGHFLAAAREANREVYGVEASALHREFIARTWGIENVFASFADLPTSIPPFASIVLFNTIEHVFDISGLFESIRTRLMRGGTVVVTTCNAECVILPIVGTYWSMLKVPDHVSIPSAEGFRRLADRTGLTCRDVWTGEMPLETPIGLAVAFRDWMRERRAAGGLSFQPTTGGDAPAAHNASRRGLMQRAIMRRIVRLARNVDPTSHLTSKLGRAATVRAVFGSQ